MSFHLKRLPPGRVPSLAIVTSDGSHDPWIPAPLPRAVELMRDTSAARWIEDSAERRPFATVGHLLPDSFDAYARVLHPASRGNDEPVRWSTVASWTGRVVHPLMQFERIAGLPDDSNPDPPWGRRPRTGEGPLAELAAVLCQFTARPEVCWIALWEGFGGLDMIEEIENVPRVTIPHRAYLLFRGPINAVPALAALGPPWHAPNLWWPDDRAWCVATDIDLDSTYVGGSRECVAALLRDPALEVLPPGIDDRVDVGADQINPATMGGLR